MISKLEWNIITKPKSLWVMLLKAKYFPNSTFLDVNLRSNSSWVWKGISRTRQIVDEGRYILPRVVLLLICNAILGSLPTQIKCQLGEMRTKVFRW